MNHTITIDREAVEDALFFAPIIAIVQDHIHSLNEVCFRGINNPKSVENYISDSTVAVWHIKPKALINSVGKLNDFFMSAVMDVFGDELNQSI